MLALVYVWLGHRQAVLWQSDLTLWQSAAMLSQMSIRAHRNYAKALYNANRQGDAMREYAYVARLEAIAR